MLPPEGLLTRLARLPIGKRGSITLRGQELQNLKRALYDPPTLLALYSLPRKQLRGGGPFLRTAVFLDQTALPRCVEQKKVKEAEPDIFWVKVFDKKESLNSQQYQIPINCRECSKPAEYLTTSPLLNCFATKGTPLPDWKSSRNISQK